MFALFIDQVQSAYKKEIVFDLLDSRRLTLIGKAKPVTLASEYIKSMTGVKSKTLRSSRESDGHPPGTPKMMFVMEAKKSPLDYPRENQEDNFGLETQEEEMSTQAIMQMTEVQSAALRGDDKNELRNLDTMGSLLNTGGEGMLDTERSQPLTSRNDVLQNRLNELAATETLNETNGREGTS